jgi:hypothetical protein
MDASDRIRRNQQATVAAASLANQRFLATWTSASTTLNYESYKNGPVPIVGAYVNAVGLPSTARIVSVTPSAGTLVISNATTTAQTTQTNVAMTSSGPSLIKYDSYDTKYNSQGGISYLSYDTGVAKFASTMGAFGCEGSN